MKYTIFNSQGQILAQSECDDQEVEKLSAMALPGAFDAHTHYIDVVGKAAIAKPSKPSADHRFNYSIKQWEDPRTLADHKAAKWRELKISRTAAMTAPLLETPFGVFDADVEGMSSIKDTIAGLNEAATIGRAPNSITWTLADDTSVSLSRRQLSEVAALLLARGNTAAETARVLRVRVDEATTVEQLAAIQWDVV